MMGGFLVNKKSLRGAGEGTKGAECLN